MFEANAIYMVPYNFFYIKEPSNVNEIRKVFEFFATIGRINYDSGLDYGFLIILDMRHECL